MSLTIQETALGFTKYPNVLEESSITFCEKWRRNVALMSNIDKKDSFMYSFSRSKTSIFFREYFGRMILKYLISKDLWSSQNCFVSNRERNRIIMYADDLIEIQQIWTKIIDPVCVITEIGNFKKPKVTQMNLSVNVF